MNNDIDRLVSVALAYDESKKPNERFHTHISNIGAMRLAYADIGTLLIDAPDKRRIVTVQIARYAQPAGSIRKAIRETFG